MGRPVKGHKGETYNRLTILEDAPNLSKVRCQCSCGNIAVVTQHAVLQGRTKSCGCLTREWRDNNEPRLKHGMTDSSTYRSWLSMRQRCLTETSPAYPRYGGAGVTITPKWDSFEQFVSQMGEKPYDGWHLDKDLFGDGMTYDRASCCWVSPGDNSTIRNYQMGGNEEGLESLRQKYRDLNLHD